MARAVTNDDGEVVAYVGSILDVTELARSEIRQRQIAEDPSNAMVRVDRSGTVSYVSPVFGMLGQPGAEHVGAPMTLHIHPDDLHLFADRDALFDNPDEMRFRRFRLISRTGGIVWVDGCSHGAVDPITGHVNEIQTSLRDVTEQVEAEQALRESEERFRVLAEAAVEGICLSDSGGIISANPAFSELYGYEPDEVVGMSISAFMTPSTTAQPLRPTPSIRPCVSSSPRCARTAHRSPAMRAVARRPTRGGRFASPRSPTSRRSS